MSSKIICNKKPSQILSEHKQKLISEVFHVFDCDEDEQLNYIEFKSACKALGCPTKKTEILKIIKSYQRNGVKDNCIEYNDFIDVCKCRRLSQCVYGSGKLEVAKKSVTDKLLKKNAEDFLDEGFILFAGDKDFIDLERLKNITTIIGEDISDSELSDMIREFDLNQDGKINREEFGLIMKNKDL